MKAQPEQIRFKRLSIEGGLSQSTVKTILNDSDGYMWFGTRDGLNRYNGNKIAIYRHNPKDPTSISSSDINYVFEDKSRNLWIATTRGIDRFDRQKEIFIHYRTSKDNIDASMLTQDKRVTCGWRVGMDCINLMLRKTALPFFIHSLIQSGWTYPRS